MTTAFAPIMTSSPTTIRGGVPAGARTAMVTPCQIFTFRPGFDPDGLTNWRDKFRWSVTAGAENPPIAAASPGCAGYW
jgi:hypothetical protein